jgi:uncharacterized membrane protein
VKVIHPETSDYGIFHFMVEVTVAFITDESLKCQKNNAGPGD